MQVFP